MGYENEVSLGQNGHVDQKLVAVVCQEMMKTFRGKAISEDKGCASSSHEDYSLWEVIINGDSPKPSVVVEGSAAPAVVLTAEQKLARINELKACGTLLMSLPNKHQLKFNSHKDAKTLMEPIEKRFGGNTKTKKVHKTLLKQQFKNFSGSSSEDLDQIHDRLQNLVSQLEIHGVSISQEDVNLKFLRNLPSEWKTHTLIWRNKTNLEEHSLDDLFNSLRIYEDEVKDSSSLGNPTQNIAFVSSSNIDSTTDSVSATTSVSAVCAQLHVSSHPNIDSLSNAIDVDDLEEMDLRWQMAMLTMRARRFLKKTGRNLGDNRVTTIGFDMSKVECYNCHRKGHFAREYRSPKDTRRTVVAEPQRRHVPVETSTSNALVSQCDGIGSYDGVIKLRRSLLTLLSWLFHHQTVLTMSCPSDKVQPSGGYNVVPPPITGNFMPPKPDLVFNTAPIAVETAHSAFNVQLSPAKPVQAMSHTTESMEPIIEDWVSDSEDESEPNDPQSAPSFIQPSEQVKHSGHSAQPVEAPILDHTPKPTSSKTTGSRKRKNRKTCFVCRGVDHLIKDCTFHAKPKTHPTPRNYVHRGYDNQYASSTKKYPQKHRVPAAVFTKSKPVSVTAARPVSTVVPKIMAAKPRHARSLHIKTNSIIRRHQTPINSQRPVTLLQKLLLLMLKWLVLLRKRRENSLQYALKDKGVIDSGCSRHMIGNISYLSDFHEINGGYVSFRGNPKGGKITGKGNIKTEAVNTACYVQNRVLVTKPQNKIPYELLHGRTPSTGPTWLFDIDSLTRTMNYQPVTTGNQTNPNAGFQDEFNAGKIGEEANQEYMLFPVWSISLTNPQNKEGDTTFDGTEHDFEDFSKDSSNDVSTASPIVLAAGQNCSNSTNPISAAGLNCSNSTNHISVDGPSNSNSSSTHGNSSLRYAYQSPDVLEMENIVYSDNKNVGAEADLNNLKSSITVSPIPTKIHNAHPISQIIEADLNNLKSSITVSPIPTKIHNAHPISQIIGNLSSTTQTRSMARIIRDQGGISQVLNEDFHTCMFACFLLQEEPTRVHQALKDPSWIEAMQEELLQFKMQKVWILVDLSQGKRAIEGIDYEEVIDPVARIEAIRLFLAYASFMGFMVYQMDVKNAFLYGTIEEEVYVCQPPGFKDPDHPDKVYKVVKALYGLHQALRAWYETLATYLLENGFHRVQIDQTLFIKKQKDDILLVQIYVDDIIFGATNKDLCKSFEKLMKDKFQMSSMGELAFFLGLQVKQKEDRRFINQDKYVTEILKKFGLTEGKSASTPIDTEKHLLKDPDGEDVDVHIYRSMIGFLMYLTSSRPDIMFAVCAYARFQVTPKISHLHAVKRIFRYLKGKPNLGLWYPKDSIFDLVAYSDSNYAGASLDRKSTTGGCQFLGSRLISWQCKKQTVVATSSTKAKYVASAS
nr:putative ribonuclease H-like domain-containing protein [Tanacetum cinerariifolium]